MVELQKLKCETGVNDIFRENQTQFSDFFSDCKKLYIQLITELLIECFDNFQV